MKKLFTCLMGISMLMLTACGNAPENSAENSLASETIKAATEEVITPEEDDEENYNTGDASLDNIRNQDEIGEKELLVISFGTSFNDNRRLTIGAIEDSLESAFPDYSVRRGFTADIIIDHVNRRDGFLIDNVGTALQRAVDNSVKTLVIQPTHLMNGLEYNDIINEVAQYADGFEQVVFGEPLLTSDEDFKRVEEAIVDWTSEYDDGKTAICFMGHGTEADSNAVYQKMQDLLIADGYENYFVGTVEAAPTVEDVLSLVQKGNYERVVLEPLMVVAGDHANNDMAGDEEDSWKSIFENAGYEVECLLRGLGENEAIRQIYIDHAQKAIDSLNESVQQETVAPVEVVEEGMIPIYGESILDGDYEVTVNSSSSMFNIESCVLHVNQGEMTADMTMGGTGYLYIYPGTAEQAESASESEYLPFTENENGEHVFTIPVEALDKGIPCAAFSKKKELWYDRTILFRADSLPVTAFADGVISSVESLALTDGDYTINVTLEGGSGKASVASPAKLHIENGQATAEIIWNSSNYDYMMVNGEKYLPISMEENSIFEIPVLGFDYKMPVSADTVAMSVPHEIDYTLYFDASTLTS